MKQITIALVVVVLAIGGWYFYKSSGKNIEDVYDHFTGAGLSVQPHILTAEEQALIEGLQELAGRLGAKSDGSLVGNETKIVNDIQVKISQYKNSSIAADKYQKEIDSETKSKQRSRDQRKTYYKTDHFVKDNFVMTIYHWKVINKNQTAIELDENNLTKIINAFNTL